MTTICGVVIIQSPLLKYAGPYLTIFDTFPDGVVGVEEGRGGGGWGKLRLKTISVPVGIEIRTKHGNEKFFKMKAISPYEFTSKTFFKPYSDPNITAKSLRKESN